MPLHKVEDQHDLSVIEGASVDGQIAGQQAMMHLLDEAGRDSGMVEEEVLGKMARQLADKTTACRREGEADLKVWFEEATRGEVEIQRRLVRERQDATDE